MAYSPEFLAAVTAAYRSFAATINKKEARYYDNQPNQDVLIKHLNRTGIPHSMWVHEEIWSSAWATLDAQDAFWKPPAPKTAAEIRAELESKDRHDGRVGNAAHRRDATRSTQEQQQEAKNWLKEQMEAFMDPTVARHKRESEAASLAKDKDAEQNAILESLPLDVDLAQMSPEQQREFKRLTPENIRRWNKRRGNWLRENSSRVEGE